MRTPDAFFLMSRGAVGPAGVDSKTKTGTHAKDLMKVEAFFRAVVTA